MDKILAFIIIFITVCIVLASLLVMGAVPKIFQTGEQTANQTDLMVKEFQRENNKTNESLKIQSQILNNQIRAQIDRDKKNEDIMIIQALLSHEERQLIKLGLDELNITNYHDPNFLNLRHHDFPFYYTNKTHVIIKLNDTGIRTIPIPYEMSNLLMQFDNGTKNITK